MRSLNRAIWTSGLPVSVGCVPYWSMRDFFCSLASTNLMHSFYIFNRLWYANRLTCWNGRCKGLAAIMAETEQRILVCPSCGNQTPHKLVFEHQHVGTWYGTDGSPSEGDDQPASIYTIFECATCSDISLYSRIEFEKFEEAALVYPRGNTLHKSVPASVASNFAEAKRIQRVSPNAFAVLVRRALEAI